MNKHDDLPYPFVLVHPELAHDPAGRKNEIGILLKSDLTDDDFVVSFPDNEYASFTSDALLVLLPTEQIHQNLADIAYETSFPVLKALTQIGLIVRYGPATMQYDALKLARDNPAIQPLCLDTLQNQLSLDFTKCYGRD